MTRILIVDDAEAVRESMSAVLKKAGYDVTEAADGEQALAMLSVQSFDLAIVDIWMPRKNGLSLLQEVRAQRSDIPIIIVSGGGPGAPLERSAALADIYGAVEVLFKPFENFELLDAVTGALEK
jgi:CheY-like chemotaxis protein